MNEININIEVFQGKRVLFTPLNWGLGHATRCIPIIKMFIDHDIDIAFASDGIALRILQEEFPAISSFEFPAYNINYKYKSMELNMALQGIKILKAIRTEQRAINTIIDEWQVDSIISDNRYGCRSEKTENIFISHQINLFGANKISSWLANKINGYFINKFDTLWLPDYKGEQSLAGDLSKPSPNIKIPTYYINALSRFEKGECLIQRDILVILSGPEPTRTDLEIKLTSILENTAYDVLIVRGSTIQATEQSTRIDKVDLLKAVELNKAILTSSLVICRSGYTSIMDLHLLNKQAILIPTPGQPEQEYLANYHEKKGNFVQWNDIEKENVLLDKIDKILKQT